MYLIHFKIVFVYFARQGVCSTANSRAAQRQYSNYAQYWIYHCA